ncbi:MAG: hypothetical protein AAAB35_00455 [Phyllobacterium sp.]|uniref:hypothetical protein n=1 Tax=Phyllobacterium sp. TaxID=1871046 RepID=UPI0030F32BCB
MTDDLVNRILTAIEVGTPDGDRYSDAAAATTRAAWKVVQNQLPSKTKEQCREMIITWIRNGLLVRKVYHSATDRKDREGLYLDEAKRPGWVS